MYRLRALYSPTEKMRFDREYYLATHVPLALRQLEKAGVRVRSFEVEHQVIPLVGATADKQEPLNPCVLNLTVESLDEVNKIRKMMQSDLVLPLREDIANYTDCEVSWTVSELDPSVAEDQPA